MRPDRFLAVTESDGRVMPLSCEEDVCVRDWSRAEFPLYSVEEADQCQHDILQADSHDRIETKDLYSAILNFRNQHATGYGTKTEREKQVFNVNFQNRNHFLLKVPETHPPLESKKWETVRETHGSSRAQPFSMAGA